MPRFLLLTIAVALAGFSVAAAALLTHMGPTTAETATTPAVVADNPTTDEGEVSQAPSQGPGDQTIRVSRGRVKSTYLGIITAPASAEARAQLALPEGVALVVQHVDPQSPAHAAGIQLQDVLVKLNDQLLINSEQLTVLLQTFAPGDEILLTVARQGKTLTLTVRLSERDLPESVAALVWSGGRAGHPLLPTSPGAGGAISIQNFRLMDHEQHITLTESDGSRYLLVKDTRGKLLFEGPINTPEERAAAPADAIQKVDRIRINSRAPGQPRGEQNEAPRPAFVRSSSFNDGEHSITLTQSGQNRHLLAADRAGNVLFNGPIDTSEQQAAVPPAVLRKVEAMGAYLQRIATEGPVEGR